MTPYPYHNQSLLSPRQMRVNNRIFAFTGSMHSGKTTAMDMLDSILTGSIYYTKIIKFAGPLYDIQKYVYARTGLNLEGSKDRELLQYIGSIWGRQKDPELWVNIWRKETRTMRLKGSAQGRDDTNVVLCDDVRFDNEAQLIKDMKGILIRVEAPEEIRRERNPSTFKDANHISEQGVRPELVDFTLYNDKDLSYLRTQIRSLVEQRLI